MIDEISVLIADDNIEFVNLLNEYICQYEDIKVKGIAHDGIEAIDLIINLKPDIVILDIIMPNLDGIGVLEKISVMQLKSRPLFIMLSALGQDVFVHKAIALGAEYYIVKPFDVEILVSRIRQIYKEKHQYPFAGFKEKQKAIHKSVTDVKPVNSLEKEVTNLIQKAGIPPHISGYQYIRDAILMSIDKSSVFNSVTRVIYPNIAFKYNTTPRKVDRAIRCAIDNAWAKGHLSRNDVNSGFAKKPTNSEFISTLADKARLGMSVKQRKNDA
jgi:two-component system, response regulator, stage 0 sporulation protein A